MTNRARTIVTLLLILAIAAPAVALGAEQARDIVLDFQSPGPMRDLLTKSLGVAQSFLFLSAFLAYALEAFGHSPAHGRDYGAVTWRLVVVLFLLWNYQVVFGSVINLVDRVEREVAPSSTWEQLRVAVARNQAALTDLASQGELPQLADPTALPATPPPKQLSSFTSWVYEAFVTVVLLLGEGLVFLIRWLSKILTATLFILGPLALVAGIPRVSSTGSRWFLRFVTIASWPIFAGVLLAVMVALGGQGAMARSYLECLVAALVLLVTALSTPVLASHVVGGALQNFAGAGYASAKGLGADGVASAVRIASGAKGVALHVVQGLGGGPGNAGQNSPRGGGGRGGGGGVATNSPAPSRPRGRGSAGGGLGSGQRGPGGR